ncbi:MAG: ISNCY family transposase [Gemmatimonadetes bacterium]|nr:ISNCY family transposase [Gemmatimonadota bacterium]MCY3943848.1 ISNCY family transposase [Gemmatimonadota bacterium]
MNRAAMLREVRMATFEGVYGLWRRKRITQVAAARVLGVTDRTFRRWVARYEAEGLAALGDRRVGRSVRRAPPEEVAAVEALYGAGHRDWNVRHFYDEVYVAEHRGGRSYTWVKDRLQEAGLVAKGRGRGVHRERRERKPAAGMMVHQDGSRHQWVPEAWWDLVVTMDDATSEVSSGFFVAEEGTWSSLRGVRETVEAKGLFDSLYTDRGSHYWHTPKAGGTVDKDNPTQFGRAMAELGVGMIAGYSPQARGRSERLFGTLQGRLPQELARAGITEMDAANEFLQDFWPRFNASFAVAPEEPESAFSPLLPSMKAKLPDVLCLKTGRTVGNDNCVSYRGRALQIPPQPHRRHFVRAKVSVHEYEDGATAVFHGTRRLGRYDARGRLLDKAEAAA